MNTLSKLVVAVFTAGSLAIGGTALAGHGWGTGDCAQKGVGASQGFGPPGGVEQRLERMTQRLSLNEQQREQVRTILEAAKPELDVLRAKIHANRDQLRALRAETGPGKQAEVQALAQVQGDSIAQMIVMRAQVHDQINAVLTAEQREVFSQMGPRGPHGGKRAM